MSVKSYCSKHKDIATPQKLYSLYSAQWNAPFVFSIYMETEKYIDKKNIVHEPKVYAIACFYTDNKYIIYTFHRKKTLKGLNKSMVWNGHIYPENRESEWEAIKLIVSLVNRKINKQNQPYKIIDIKCNQETEFMYKELISLMPCQVPKQVNPFDSTNVDLMYRIQSLEIE